MNLNDAIIEYNPSQPSVPSISDVLIDDSKKIRTQISPYANTSISDIIIPEKSIDTIQQMEEKIAKFEKLVKDNGDINLPKGEIQGKYIKELNQLAKDLGSIAYSSSSDRLEGGMDELVSIIKEGFEKIPKESDDESGLKFVSVQKVSTSDTLNPNDSVDIRSDTLDSADIRSNLSDSVDIRSELDYAVDEIKNESLEHFEKATDNFVHSVKENYTEAGIIKGMVSPVATIFNNTLDDIAGLYDYVLNQSYIGGVISDLPSFLGSFIENSITKPLTQLIGTATDSAAGLVDIGGNIVSQFKDYAEDWISNKITNISSTVTDLSSDLSDAVNDWLSSILGPRYSEGISDMIVPKYVYSDFSSDDGPNKRQQWAFRVNSDLELSNEMYWSVQVTPNEGCSSDRPYPPLLQRYFGLSQGDRLPIISFDLASSSMSSQEYDLFPGSVLQFPSQYNRPTKIVLNFPEYVNRSRESTFLVLQSFKQDFLDYVFRDVNSTSDRNESSSNAVRDFRDCCYRIEVTKYSMSWSKAMYKRYLAYPEVSINVRGSAQSSVEMTELIFNIVGEYYG